MPFLLFSIYAFTVLPKISSLLVNPGVDKALVAEIAEMYTSDREQYKQVAREWTDKYAK